MYIVLMVWFYCCLCKHIHMRTFVNSLLVVVLISLTSFSYKKSLIVTSYAIKANGYIPVKYTCLGQGASPPLNIANLPTGTRSLAVIVEDVDYTHFLDKKYVAPRRPGKKGSHIKKVKAATVAQADTCYINWLTWNIDTGSFIPENYKNDFEGLNTANARGYIGMCASKGAHHIHFKVYALDTKLNLTRNASKADLQKIMEGHILGWGELVALYDKDYR